ncbi:serine protease snake isoform X2 [Drosophila rhopaloa]|uniref:Serine protease snake isoform X2 n=1 Tax=Drosophila rhopaloa TaxID=1041015 RepID=A0A6P4EES1_DRORH|nr:serine protease snake isoform X2 [Drosophila rhopaloa]
MGPLYFWLLEIVFISASSLIVSASPQSYYYNGYAQSVPWTGVVPSYVSIDNFGNCQAYDRPLVGRCVRYVDCISALQSVPQVTPLLCPSSWPNQLVCCPHGGYLIPEPRISKSEEACSNAYPRARHKRRRRRRNTTSNKDQVELVEPIIQKRNQSDNFLVGGRLTMDNEHPYMCALGCPSRTNRWIHSHGSSKRRYTFNCGCVMISPRFAITAAHCANIGGESPSVALIGGVELNSARGQLIEILQITKHPNFDEETLTNDLAVVKLARRSHKPVACLWNQESLPESPLTALGYGQTKFAGPHSNELLQILLYPLNNQQCQRYLQNDDKLVHGLGSGQLCAGDYSGKMDTCQGDSGGPLLLHQHMRHQHHRIPYVVGLTSFGGACATGEPGVYVRISHYLQWIEQQVWP